MEKELHIRLIGESVLRQRAKAVGEVTPELADFAEKMLETMYDAPGIGLAAPQVGRSIRLIVVDCSPSDSEKYEPHILFNPEILPESESISMEEGCLSVPEIYAQVQRPEVVSVNYRNEKGEEKKLEKIDGLLSRCIQHEVDHLDGVLFVDKISPADRALLSGKIKKISGKNKG